MGDFGDWGHCAPICGGLKVSKTGALSAVGSRSLETASAFTEKHGGKPYGSYQEVLDDPEVDAVYIATPHHLHSEWTVKAAQAGKGILCEKPFTLNAIEAEKTLAEVKKHGVFFMEAFMYRCHPQTLKTKALVVAGEIGEVQIINAEFGFAAGRDWGNFRADGAVGGGGLMDVGTYCVSFARLMVGSEPTRTEYIAEITDRGYDAMGSGLLGFEGGISAHFATGIHVNLRNDATVYGTKGRIHVAEPWKCGGGKLTLTRYGGESEVYELGSSNDELYGYEADAVAEFFEAKECPYMSLDDTIFNMRALDGLRASAGLKFANEWTTA